MHYRRMMPRVAEFSTIDLGLSIIDNNVSLLQRLSSKMDLRNTDRYRLTSLSWAAVEGSLEVFEWLLLDYGHDDLELSRVSERPCYCQSEIYADHI